MWDVAVVGLGGVGSFALRSLVRHHQRDKPRVIGLERFKIGHTNGSSHGGTRIYRHAYFEHYNYVPLLKYSTQEFETLQRHMGRPIIEPCGNLIIERKKREGSKSNGSSTPVIEACLKSARRHSINVELITDHTELSRRYPQFHFDQDHIGMIEPGGGFVRPEVAVRAAIDDALDNGVLVREGIKIESVQEKKNSGGDGYVAIQAATDEGKHETIRARKVIVAGGPWAGRLIPQWSPHLRVTKQVQAWIDVDSTNIDMYCPSTMPTWIRAGSNTMKDDDGNSISPPHLYGFPVDPRCDNPAWMKIALHGRDDPVDPEDMVNSRRDVKYEELDELREAAAPFLPAAAASDEQCKFIDAKTCLYTCSPDEHFIVGTPESSERIFGAAGLSGHGFKMVPALGKALGDLALDDTTDLPIQFLSPSRFRDC